MRLYDISESNSTGGNDVALCPQFAAAQLQERIHAAAAETEQDEDRYYAEQLAQYIIALPPTDGTLIEQHQVGDILSVSRYADSELASNGLTRADVTQRLEEANQTFLTAQALEVRAHLQLMCVWG